MRARLHPYRLPLRRPWVAASATLTERHGWLVEITDDDGTTGWGDCAPLPSTGEAGHLRVRLALETAIRRPATADFADSPPEVRWALETAFKDIEAQQRGVPLAVLLGAKTIAVPVNAALGPLDGSVAERMAAAVAQGFHIAKIKVGIASVEEELARLRKLNGPLRLRLDANRAWSYDDATRFLHGVADLPIDGAEEPLAEPSCAALARLQAELPFPIAVDESLPLLGVDALLATRAVRRFIVKPARIGGVSPMLTLARRAQEAGVEVVLTSVVDSAVGVTAAAHLAAAIAPDMAHGLATSAWLASDVATPPVIIDGHLVLPGTPGLGIRPLAD